jgi:hypothetical protein
MQSSPSSHHFLPLKSKYSPQHPVLKHNLCSFLSVKDQLSHLQKNNRHNYSCVHLIFKFLERREEDNQTVASIPQIQSAHNFFMNVIFIYCSCSHMLEPCHTFKGLLIISKLWLFWILVVRHNHVLGFLYQLRRTGLQL